MSDHYAGNDPEGGCAMLMIVGIFACLFWAIAIVWFLPAVIR